MNTNILAQEVTKFLLSTNTALPAFIGVGTGTVSSARSNTILSNHLSRDSNSWTIEDMTGQMARTIGSTTSALFNQNVAESGSFSQSIGGFLFDRAVSSSALRFTSGNEMRITKFIALDNTPTSSNNFFMDDGMNEVLLRLSGDATATAPSQIAWGADLVLHQCDTVRDIANNWNDGSSAATNPTLNTTNYREGVASINMGKDGTTSGIFFYRIDSASVFNCRSVAQFKMDFRCDNSTDLAKFTTNDCLRMRVGSNSVNYREFNFDRSNLIVGWQTLSVSVSSMSTQGSPDLTAVDFLEIRMETATVTDTITHGNLIMDYWRGYWSLTGNESTLHDERERNPLDSPAEGISSTTARLLSTMLSSEGNSFNYNFTGLFNDPTSGDLFFAIETFNERKDSTIQITTEFQLSVGFYD